MIKERSKKSGFSFIELLIAFVIIFSLILGTAQLTIHSLMLKKRSDYRLDISAIIFSQLEQLKAQFFSESGCQEGRYASTIEGFAGNQPIILEWIIQTSQAGMKSIELNCYPENAPGRETRLLLYLSESLGF